MIEVLRITVHIDYTETVKGQNGTVHMIHFNGTSNCPNFTGQTIPGSIDTQTIYNGQEHKLSARYIMQGVDCTGEKCRLYIENNGICDDNEIIHTTPKVITDSSALAYLETTKLYGTVITDKEDLLIRIYLLTNKSFFDCIQ